MLRSRLQFYGAKIKAAWASGTLGERVQRKLLNGAATSAGSVTRYARLSKEDRDLDLDEGFADHRHAARIDPALEEAAIRRLMAAYERAKADQLAAPAHHQIRGLWAEWIDVNYGELIRSVTSNEIDRAAALLQNFAREQFAVGTGSSYDDLVHFQSPAFGKAYVRTVWCDYRDKLVDADFDLAEISFPLVGNPAGVPVNGSIIQIETLRHAYNGLSIRHLLADVPRPVIVEIGGGFGGQAFQTIHQLTAAGRSPWKYIDFDIPEVLIVAGYFLLMAFPDLNVRLYGEGKISVADDEQFDIGVFPHFAIDALEPDSVDLFFNSNSFSEMDRSASTNYLKLVEQACRRYFLHINHEVRLTFKEADGGESVNAVGSELVPDRARFKRIFKRPRLFQRPEDRPYKAFAYLYEHISK